MKFECITFFALLTLSTSIPVGAVNAETLPVVGSDHAPQNLVEMWSGFDPRAEPLDTEVLKEWSDDHATFRVVRFRIGLFKGSEATLAAVYGFPRELAETGKKVPGLVQIHGGGQYADHKACLANAKRGYATVSIAWAGRISAPDYRVGPNEVKLFWEGKTDAPNYRLTTDWGVLDGYHAPSRNQGNVFPSVKQADWTFDRVESPRNSGWFLCALAARRAITFLEQQPEVDPNRLGVYGHSMGGKLTVMTAIDERVKAAAPSCGGISDRYNNSPLYRRTLGDDVSLQKIQCPIIFLSPANDFHGRIGDLPSAVKEIDTRQWRVTCSPHHNHQDTPEFEVATLLWFDQHLKDTFDFPQTPQTTLHLENESGVPTLVVQPDNSKPLHSVDVYYTQHGVAGRDPHENTMHRHWHHAAVSNDNGVFTASLPVLQTDKPLWAYANVRYPLDRPVSGAGYYYGDYSANAFNVSSVLTMVSAKDLASAGVQATLERSTVIENFEGDWKKEWFTYRPNEWARTTHKLYSDRWKAPVGANLVLELQASEKNRMVVLLDEHAAEVDVKGMESTERLRLKPSDFKNYRGEPLADFQAVRRLKISPSESLRPGRGESGQPRIVGAKWQGTPPKFRSLHWSTDDS